MALLALDDTDTRSGGCTTHTAYRLAVALDRHDGPLAPWGLIAPPRLVRLCPAIREKTRGNGALVVPVGRVDRSRVGVVIGRAPDGHALVMRPESDPSPATGAEEAALRRLIAAHLPHPGAGEEDPQPAALLLPGPSDGPFYGRAVAQRVTAQDAWAAAPEGAELLTPPGRRGEIGALAASAWRPHPETMTWEAIGYRDPQDPRVLPQGFDAALDALPGGFDNIDTASGRLRAVPRTPCPVRFGIRGLDPHALLALAGPLWCANGGTGGWLLATNHARGDHHRHAATSPGPERVVHLDLTVEGAPQRTRGGHLFVDAMSGGDGVRVAAYEPTKTLRRWVGRLRPGDEITALGRTAEDPQVVALERFTVRRLAPRIASGPNPRCDLCDKAMKSRGKDAGFRCPSCHARRPVADRTVYSTDPGLALGVWYQVPDHIRGHLLGPHGGLPPALPLMRSVSARPTQRM